MDEYEYYEEEVRFGDVDEEVRREDATLPAVTLTPAERKRENRLQGQKKQEKRRERRLQPEIEGRKMKTEIEEENERMRKRAALEEAERELEECLAATARVDLLEEFDETIVLEERRRLPGNRWRLSNHAWKRSCNCVEDKH